jgi:hypothetical protein
VKGAFNGSISFTNDEANNPFDTSFPFAERGHRTVPDRTASSRAGRKAATSRINHEMYIQDNWKAKSNLTLDYGVRFVHQVPQYDSYGNASNFFPEDWQKSQAPVLYVAGCANGAATCSAPPVRP